MKTKKKGLPTIKKPNFRIERKYIFRTLKILAAGAAIVNLLLLFLFNYGLTDVPPVPAPTQITSPATPQ